MTPLEIINELKSSPVVCIEPVKGRDGLCGVALVSMDKYYFIPRGDDWNEVMKEILKVDGELCVWDLRRIIDWPLSDDRVVYDVKSVYGGDQSIQALAKKVAGQHFLELDQKMVAHARALKTVKMDLPAAQAVPPELIRDWVKARAILIKDLHARCKFSSGPEGILSADYESRWPFIRALREVELNGIAVDEEFISAELLNGAEQATKGALRSMEGLCKGGYVTSLFNPMGGKTGRVRHEGGFNALAIPHGASRNAIVSRFEEGLIVGLDFNAIDYRCIVNTIGGDLAKLYEGATDFHERTASFIFKQVTPATRQSIKFLSYIYIYGGSDETLQKKTGWSLEQVKKVLDLLDKKIGPIKEFRAKLWMKAQQTGLVIAPGGRRVHTLEGDNEGKVIGLYAQTYSSWVFEQAVIRIQKLLRSMKSKLIFTVHDELVIDVHPEEFGMIEEFRRVAQIDGHVIKVKKGSSYGSLE